MDWDRIRATAIGFAGAFVVLGLLLYLVGIDDLLAELASANTRTVLFVIGLTLCWLVAWSLELRTVLGVLGESVSVGNSFLLFSGATFSNNITPFGQAGGEPITALLISKVVDTEYEQGLASIASVDTLNFVPSITLALIGVAYFATEVTFGTRLRLATAVVALLAVVVPGLIYLGWRNRYELEHTVVTKLTPAIRRISSVIPGVSTPDQSSIESRIGHFFTAIERIARDRRGIVLSLAASSVGWGFQMLGLWFAFQAIGASVPLSAVLFVVPMGAIAGITPLPGGVGGIEAVLVAVLSALPGVGVGPETALAAVIIYRGAVYWIPMLIGGTVVSVIGADGVR